MRLSGEWNDRVDGGRRGEEMEALALEDEEVG